MTTTESKAAESGAVAGPVDCPVKPLAPKRCTDREKCQGEDTRYDTVSSGPYSLTLKCRACGFIHRSDWD